MARKKTIDKSFSENSLKRKHLISRENGKCESFQKIANGSDMDVATVKRIMNGTRCAKLGEAFAIAKALGTSVNCLSRSPDHKDLDLTVAEWVKIVAQRDVLEAQLIEIHQGLKDCDSQAKILWENFHNRSLGNQADPSI